VVQEVLSNPHLVAELFSGVFIPDPGLRLRCSDALAKVAHHNPPLLQPYTHVLIDTVSTIDQQEVQWHLAEIISLIELDQQDQEKAVTFLLRFLETTKSNIVKVFSLQALTDIARRNNTFKGTTIRVIKQEMEQGAPSIVSRGKKLLKLLENEPSPSDQTPPDDT